MANTRKNSNLPTLTSGRSVVSIQPNVDDGLSPRGSSSDIYSRNSSFSNNNTSSKETLHEPEVLSAIFMGIPMGCIVIDYKGQILAFSHGARKMLLYEPWEVTGENVKLLMSEHLSLRHDFYLARSKQRIEDTINSQLDIKLSKLGYNFNTINTSSPSGKYEQTATFTINDLLYCPSEIQGAVKLILSKVLLFGGQSREVQAVDKTGSTLYAEIRVSTLLVRGQLCYLAFVTDLRDISGFQMTTVQQGNLLSSLMDEKTISRVIKGEQLIFDKFDSASVLFCDIIGYTSKAHQLSDDQVITFLNEVFGLFDRTVTKAVMVEKIKTIGDCYMAACGVPNRCETHAVEIVKVAQEFIRNIHLYNHYIQTKQSVSSLLYSKSEIKKYGFKSKYNADDEWRQRIIPVSIRIGVHSGPVLGGIMSRVKGFYDIIGDTVNYASRLEHTAPTNHIQISEATYGLLPSQLQSEWHRVEGVLLKGIGTVNTYTNTVTAS